ncbi:hypothetical protein BH11BAC7_BH11BAC7_05080 [soil metagenome]
MEIEEYERSYCPILIPRFFYYQFPDFLYFPISSSTLLIASKSGISEAFSSTSA